MSNWRKSTYSGYNGECVEVGAWRKSSRSTSNGQCAEVGHGTGVVAVRDTKDQGTGPVLKFGPTAWREFVAGLKRGGDG